MALAVGKTEHFDAGKALQRPGKAGGGILSAGEQHQRGRVLRLIAHAPPLALSIPAANRWKGRSVLLVSLGWPRILRHTGLTFLGPPVFHDPFPRYFTPA